MGELTDQVAFPDLDRTCCGNSGQQFIWWVQQPFLTSVKLSIPATTVPDGYMVELTIQSNGVTQTLPLTFTVAAPSPVDPLSYATFAEGPGLAQYEQQMRSHGVNEMCDEHVSGITQRRQLKTKGL